MERILNILPEKESTRSNWLIRFRWLAIFCALFIAFSTKYILRARDLPMFHLLGNIVILILCNIVLTATSKQTKSVEYNPRYYTRLIHFQLILDLLFLTAFLHFFGGLETPLFFFYLLYISIGCITLRSSLILIYAGLAGFLYTGMLILEAIGIMPHYNLSGFRMPFRYQQPIHIFTASFTLITTSLITTYFVSNIVSKLWQRDNELLESNKACKLRAQELAEVNAQLKEQDKARAQFIYLVTHELRAPVAAIQSYLRLILEGYVKPENQNEIIGKSEKQALKQLALIGDLLQLAKIEDEKIGTKIETVNIGKVLEEVADLMNGQAREKRINFKVQIDPEIPSLEVDLEHMKQLWTDLISNSIKYTNSGGEVSVLLEKNSTQLIGTISDTGIGIAEEDIARIFDNFYRAKNAKAMEKHGTGLGLSIVKGILSKYEGDISVDSELGKGSQFRFALPYKKD